ncbi:hypothetical protein ACFLS1_04680 [Verrucomicrobiota bacterium]
MGLVIFGAEVLFYNCSSTHSDLNSFGIIPSLAGIGTWLGTKFKLLSNKTIVAIAGSVLVILVLYVGSYIPNSLAGGWVVNESGKCRPFFLASCDQYIWIPRYGFCQKFRWPGGRNGIRAWGFLGKLYAPLILIDQAYFHRTIRYMNEDLTFVKPFPVPPIEEYHPTRVNAFAGRFPYRPITNTTEEIAEQTPTSDSLKAQPEE